MRPSERRYKEGRCFRWPLDILSHHIVPITFKITDENLVVQIICFHLAPCHIGRKAEHFGNSLGIEISCGYVEFLRNGEALVKPCQHNSPFAKGGDVDMIGRGVQLGRFEGGDDRPVGVGCEIRPYNL